MNKMRLHFLLLFSSLILLDSGCKKNPFDYRTKYVGDYDYVNSWSSWVLGGPVTSGTNYTTGKIEYGKKGYIEVTFDNNSPTNINEFQVDRDGNLSYSNGTKVGTITKTKLNYHNPGGSGLGGGGTSDITGTKK